MASVDMDVGKYLRRIGATLSPGGTPGLEALRSLHLRHLLTVPFEDLTLLYDKIVNRHRGGFCYENNGMFAWLLGQLGFQVTLLSGQVMSRITGYFGPPFDHLILMVSLEGRRWLCDVGFGAAGFFYPVSLDTSDPQEQGHRVYRLRNHMGMHFLEWQHEEIKGADGEWSEIYKFTLEPRRMEDFSEMCEYHQSSPCSIFFCKSVCTILTPGGRITLICRKLTTITFPSKETGVELETTTRDLQEDEIAGILAEKFGIVLDSPLKSKDDTVTPPPVMY